MTGSLLNQGFTLLAFGMGMVFVFLTLLVIGTTIMSQFIGKFFPEAVIEPIPQQGSRTAQSDDHQLISVITAAVHKYRSRHKK